VEAASNVVIEAEQKGFNHLPHSHLVETIKPVVASAHVHAFEVTFYAAAGIAMAGALVSFVLVRKGDRIKAGATGIFTRRSRWILATSGRSPALTRRPPPRPGESASG
jgi:hypothetical protein